MALTKEATLQQAYSILDDDDKLQKKIFDLKTNQQGLKCEIEDLTKNIKLLEKQKAKKSWKIICFNIITFGIFKYHRNKKFDKKINEMQIKSEKLRIKITENTKIKWSLKNKRLKIATKIINILKNLLSDSKKQVINVQTEIHQEISQKLDAILEHQKFKTVDHTNSSSLLMSDSSGCNSDDEQQHANDNSRLQNDKDSGLKQSLAVTCKKSNHNDDDSDIEVISKSEENDDDSDIGVISEFEKGNNFDICELNDSWLAELNSINIIKKELQKIKDKIDGIEVISESDDSIKHNSNNICDITYNTDNIIIRTSNNDIKPIYNRKGNIKDKNSSHLKQLAFDQKLVNSDNLVKLFNFNNKSYQQNKI